jgi:hypothetical protein
MILRLSTGILCKGGANVAEFLSRIERLALAILN